MVREERRRGAVGFEDEEGVTSQGIQANSRS